MQAPFIKKTKSSASSQENENRIHLKLTALTFNKPQAHHAPLSFPPFSARPKFEYHPIYQPRFTPNTNQNDHHQDCISTLVSWWALKRPKLKGYFPCILPIFFLVTAGILRSLTVYYRDKEVSFPSVAGALSFIAWNLKADPFLDIQGGTSCPTGYQAMLLGSWPGTVDGCDYPGHLKIGRCEKPGRGFAGDIDCTNIPAISWVNIWSWDAFSWCGLKAKFGDEYKRAVECAAGFRKCSSGVCVLETLGCPVTKVKLEGGVFETETIEGESPVIDLVITPNDIPCFSVGYFAAGSVPPYILINENEKGCGKYGLDDQCSFQLDVKKQKDLFEENDFPEEVMDLVGYKTVYQKTDSVLSFRKRLNVAEKDFCLNIETEDLEKTSQTAEGFDALFEGISRGVVICHFFVILVVVLLFGYSSYKNNTCFAKFSELRKTHDIALLIIFYALLGGLEYIGVTMLFGVTTYYRIRMAETRRYLERLSEEGCFLNWQARTAIIDSHVVDAVTENVFGYCLGMFL